MVEVLDSLSEIMDVVDCESVPADDPCVVRLFESAMHPDP
jgi:hypothetical protein